MGQPSTFSPKWIPLGLMIPIQNMKTKKTHKKKTFDQLYALFKVFKKIYKCWKFSVGSINNWLKMYKKKVW